MRAIIIATGLNADLSALNERYPVSLLPLIDRPFIQHIIETLVDRGVTDFDFILNHLPEKLEHFLGNGARWGSKFRFHLVRDASRPYSLLKSLNGADSDGYYLLAHADRLPQLPKELPAEEPRNILYCRDGAVGSIEENQWTGWAWISSGFIKNLPSDLNEESFEACLRSACSLVEVPQILSIRSYEELLSTQATVLGKEFSGLMLSGAEADAGIWISRNVSLPPTVKLIPPVYIGENCRIGMGTQLGPNAVVGNNCVLDARCTATNSVIFPGSYVGEALELNNVIIDKNLLVNASLGAAIPIADDFILGSLAENQIRAGFGRLLSRVIAIVLLLFIWPILLLTAIVLKLVRRGPALVKREYVILPADTHETLWRTFRLWSFESENATSKEPRNRLSNIFLRFLPALVNIAKGELSFVGVRPRSKEEVRHLPSDWQTLYLHSKAGIITEAEVLYGDSPDEDELYSAEAFYSAAAGIGHDMKILLGYFGLSTSTS